MSKKLQLLVASCFIFAMSSIGAHAASVTLQNATASSCVYTSIAVDAAGNMSVGCTGANDPPPPPPPPPPQPTTCPAPQGAVSVPISSSTTIPVFLSSGTIGYSAVPLPTLSTKSSVRYEQSIGTSTANQMHTEISVSHCPGVILTPTTAPAIASQCYISTDYTLDVRMDIYTKPVFTWNSQATLGSRGCWAPASEGQWYLNFRWTYQSCPFGQCGFVMQWLNGAY